MTIPAGTFPNGQIEWRVMATGTNGVASDWTEWFELTTIDEPPLAPINLYPSSGQEDGTKPIQFYWTHRSPLSTPQYAFDLQITYNSGATWITLASHVVQQSGDFIAAANTIIPTDPTGLIGWRVRTYNSDDIAGPWAAMVQFIVHTAPQRPTIISVTAGKSRPEVRWQSTGQVGWELEVVNGDTIFYSSGEQPGEDKAHHIKSVYLANGIYTVRLRIKNIRGVFSDWATYNININAPKRTNTVLTAEVILNGAGLSWTTEVTPRS